MNAPERMEHGGSVRSGQLVGNAIENIPSNLYPHTIMSKPLATPYKARTAASAKQMVADIEDNTRRTQMSADLNANHPPTPLVTTRTPRRMVQPTSRLISGMSLANHCI
jgi:hypothetical protein